MRKPSLSRRLLSHVSSADVLLEYIELAKFAPKPSTTSLIPSSSSSQHPNSSVTPLVKHVLSRELQLYFTRLTEALGSATTSSSSTVPSTEVREAALGSVRNDPGLHQLVPYLIAWGGEQVRAPLPPPSSTFTP